jgi:hypothetical protein
MKILPPILAFIPFVAIIAIPPALLQYTGNAGLITNGFWTIFGFMAGLTFLVVTAMLVVKKRNKEYFTQAFLGGTTVKILACLVFILVFVAKNKVDKAYFLADFFYIYLLNTAFEIYVLLRSLRLENLR